MDIVLGAIVVCAYVARELRVTMPWECYVALGLAIWLIYTIDHFLDTQKVEQLATARHRFLREHSLFLQWLCVLILVAGSILAFRLPREIIFWALGMGLCSITYLLIAFWRRSFLLKEVLVAIIYSSGVLLAPYVIAVDTLTFAMFLTFLELLLLALINLLIFAFLEYDQDKAYGFHSIVQSIGLRKTYRLIWIIILLTFLLAFFDLSIMDIETRVSPVPFIVMLSIFALIFAKKDYFANQERYRIIGDGAFLVPIIFLL
ncbi:MAG: hypothetical protein KI790_21250 [Cyclobacteriaceae bacterium]|nr:hypothetical protein [Cyclobacteriaceae bacterium HetDA_MAG_MS6]